MAFSHYTTSPVGRRVILGSGFFWAWLDGLFMSALFAQSTPHNRLAEAAMMLTFFSCAIVTFLCVLSNRRSLATLIRKKRVIAAAAFAGSVGSFAYIAANLAPNPALMLFGGVSTGVFMALSELNWGLIYCRDGARSATPYAAGGFACAPFIDLPLILMLPWAQALFFALLPLASGALLIAVVKRECPSQDDEALCDEPAESGPRHFFHQHLGISAMLLFAVVLVMTCFGYLQHFISFDSASENGLKDGIAIQAVRGLSAIVLFVMLETKPKYASTLYRLGFLTMIAGVMTLPFSFGTSTFLVSGMLIIAGYTVFDLFTWVAFSHIARTHSKNTLRTVGVIRLFASLCAAFGCLVAFFLSGAQDAPGQLASQEVTLVGYLLVIATVLLLSSEDAHVLLRNAQLPLPVSAPSPEQSLEERLARWGEDMRFTAREKEIAVLLVQGRTQPRIAEMLSISENTVGTHVRHLYQKTEVHDRQQFIDLALSSISPESRDADDPIAETD